MSHDHLRDVSTVRADKKMLTSSRCFFSANAVDIAFIHSSKCPQNQSLPLDRVQGGNHVIEMCSNINVRN